MALHSSCTARPCKLPHTLQLAPSPCPKLWEQSPQLHHKLPHTLQLAPSPCPRQEEELEDLIGGCRLALERLRQRRQLQVMRAGVLGYWDAGVVVAMITLAPSLKGAHSLLCKH